MVRAQRSWRCVSGLIICNTPPMVYGYRCWRYSEPWFEALPLTPSQQGALVCGMFGAVMVPLWGGFALQSLVLVADRTPRKHVFTIQGSDGWCCARGLACCFGGGGVRRRGGEREGALQRLRWLAQFLWRQSPPAPMPWHAEIEQS